mgnify:CR=1 FL=1
MEARERQDKARIADEVGDLLFVAVNVARFLGVDPETALANCNRKFDRRFRHVESSIKKQGREMMPQAAAAPGRQREDLVGRRPACILLQSGCSLAVRHRFAPLSPSGVEV